MCDSLDSPAGCACSHVTPSHQSSVFHPVAKVEEAKAGLRLSRRGVQPAADAAAPLLPQYVLSDVLTAALKRTVSALREGNLVTDIDPKSC